jgi:hypothetical protein
MSFDYNGPQMHTSKWAAYKPTEADTDFYAYTQTCRFGLLTPYGDSQGWKASQLASAKKALSSLPPGDHQVKVELKYQIVPHQNNLDRPVHQQIQPITPLPISEPIASGSFKYTALADGEKICFEKGLTWLPVRKSPLPTEECAEIEKSTLNLLKSLGDWGKRSMKCEEPIFAQCTGDFYTGDTWIERIGTSIIEHPSQYVVDVDVLFYRNPETGWDKESIALFHLGACTPKSKNPTKSTNFVGVSVGSNDSGYVYNDLPEFVKKTIKRCSENML